jgi:hypothetical protein
VAEGWNRWHPLLLLLLAVVAQPAADLQPALTASTCSALRQAESAAAAYTGAPANNCPTHHCHDDCMSHYAATIAAAAGAQVVNTGLLVLLLLLLLLLLLPPSPLSQIMTPIHTNTP